MRVVALIAILGLNPSDGRHPYTNLANARCLIPIDRLCAACFGLADAPAKPVTPSPPG